ncbi:MAG TPA: hypothetical protein VIG62_20565 [Blastocatellia bacterium]|jgi:hypothetical protein
MKTCPVCNETFGNDFNFCDVDGVKLEREGSPEGARNRLYSMLGIGLLVGAIVISGISMVFLSRSTVSSKTSATAAVSSPSRAGAAETVASADNTAAAAEAETPAETAKPAPTVKKEILPAANANQSLPTPDVKAAALQESERPASAADAAKAASQPAVETEPSITPVSETRPREAEPGARSAKAATEAKKESEKQSVNAKGEKESDKKKDEGKDKKKGGFLKVFKKIFGKD